MKDLVNDLLKIEYAVGYTGERISPDQVYYSVGNAIFRYRVINIIDHMRVQYEIDSYYDDDEWQPYAGDNKMKIIESHYLCSHNLYEQQYGFIYI